MIVELKWDQSAEGVVKQIKEKNYPKALEQFDGEILLVGLNYDVIKKKHTCSIQNCRR